MDSQRADLVDLDKIITSYAVLHDQKHFCLAYNLSSGSGVLNPQVTIVLFNEDRNEWIRRSINFDSSAIRPGSILAIHCTKSFLYLDSHINPSAGMLIVLTDQLAYHDVIYGWFLGVFNDETVVYHNNQIHLAPTHCTEISFYNPRSRLSRMIYPLKPYQEIRLAHTAKVRAAYERKGEDWFRNHNHHMNPELFNTKWNGQLAVSDTGHAIAFTIGYDNTEYWADDDRLKLEGFRELGRRLNDHELIEPLEDGLFMSLEEDIRRARRLNGGDAIVDLFKGDKELQQMIRSLLDTGVPRNGIPWRTYLVSMNARWNDVKCWQRLAHIISVPGDEITDVLYVCRHVDDKKHIEYKEMLLADAKTAFGSASLSSFLGPVVLNRMFGMK